MNKGKSVKFSDSIFMENFTLALKKQQLLRYWFWGGLLPFSETQNLADNRKLLMLQSGAGQRITEDPVLNGVSTL